MGLCQSKPQEQKSETTKNIDQILTEQKKEEETEIKILLLGAGESGKSTIIKQMKMIYQDEYTTEEREQQREIIYGNLVQCVQFLCAAMTTLGIEYADAGSADAAKLVLDQPNSLSRPDFPANLAAAAKSLWADKGIQQAYKRRAEYQLNDSCKYYLDELDRISLPEYLPTDQDILRARVKTTGIIETDFNIKGNVFKMYDVGGQRSERKKWIHCFENVTTIVFLVAISEYDQKLVEDDSVNRMDEALSLFDSICNSRWFAKTPIILFLNKIDLFQDKILYESIEDTFDDYEGGTDFDAGCDYFKNKFLSLNNNPKRSVYVNYTCATDTTQVKNIMENVQDTIIKQGVENAGLA